MTDLNRFAEANCWPAPGKLNLCLYVVGKRDDGYHNLETLFQLLDYGDELSFETNSSGLLTRDYDLGFSEEVDLCLRAARLLQVTSGTQQGVAIGLQKRLPMGGGLGGGSSDAATVLIALNHLWRTGLNRQQLATLGVQLGADVPVFVHGHSAWGSGIGEQLSPALLPIVDWLVVTPKIHISTADIFSHNRLTARPQMKKIRALKMGLAKGAFDFAAADNQFEPLVRADYPEVESTFEWFASIQADVLAGPARLSGSGSTVFAPLKPAFSSAKNSSNGNRDTAKARSLLAELPAHSSGFIAKGVNTHPLC